MAELHVQGMPMALVIWARLQLQQCSAPECVCPQALLFVWPEGHTSSRGTWKNSSRWELRTRDGRCFQGKAPNDPEAVRFGAVTLAEHGLQRMRVVYARPVEVPRG